MLSHFNKLNTQLKSVNKYPTLESQLQRFSLRGWNSALVWTLWQAWADERFFSADDRRKLDEVEPFDEWEEFALFGSHYCLVHASAKKGPVKVAGTSAPIPNISAPVETLSMRFDEWPGQKGQRRFGVAMMLSQGQEQAGQSDSTVVNVMGLGTKSRLQSCDVYTRGSHSVGRELTFGDGGPTTRVCHSLTELGDYNKVLLAGGRDSPSKPFQDCWLFDKGSNTWGRTHDLPEPLYRHSVTSLQDSGLALLVGGKGEGAATIFDGCLLYRPDAGWAGCEIVGEIKPEPVYGAVLACEAENSAGRFRGIFAGGLRDGLIVDQVLSWELDISGTRVCFCLLCKDVGTGMTNG